jgi:HSP20 family protein
MTQLLPERRSQRSTERWNASSGSDLDRVNERMRSMLDQLFADSPWASLAREATAWVPDVDIEEQDDAYVVEAELPGVDRKDLNVELVGNELTVTGEVKERERKGVLRRRTRRVGRFELHVVLPDRVDSEGIRAELEHGVLTVRVPKSEAAQRRRIEVQS